MNWETNPCVIIDPVAMGRGKIPSNHLFAYINDGRFDISQAHPTDADTNRFNLEFVNCIVNGWPRCFVITTKNIKINQQLFANYGCEYSDLIFQKKQRKLKINSIKKKINLIMNE